MLTCFALGLSLTGCVGPEPDSQHEALSEAAYDRYDPEAEVMDFDEIRSAGLGATISEDVPPPAFDPSEVEHPVTRADRSLMVALHSGVPRLVDVVAIEASDGEELLSAVDVDSGARVTVVLPLHYSCSTAATVLPASRYVLITSHEDGRGFHVLYLGVGAEHSIMQVDERGRVDTRAGSREARDLIAESRRAL